MMGISRTAEDVREDIVTNVRLFLNSSINDAYIMKEVVDFLGEAFCVTLNSIQDVYDVEALKEVAHMCWCQISDEINEDVLRNLQVNENITRIKLSGNSKITDELGSFLCTKRNLTYLHFGSGERAFFNQFFGVSYSWFLNVFKNEHLKYVDCRELCWDLYKVTDEFKQKFFNTNLRILLDKDAEMLMIEEHLMWYSTHGGGENYLYNGMVSLTDDDFQNYDTFTARSSRYQKSRFQKVPTFVDFVMTILFHGRNSEWGEENLHCDEKGWECLTEPSYFHFISDPCKIFPTEEVEATVLKHFRYENDNYHIYEFFETDSKFLVFESSFERVPHP